MKKKKHYSRPEIEVFVLQVEMMLQETSVNPGNGKSYPITTQGNPGGSGNYDEDEYGGHEGARGHNGFWDDWDD